MKWFDEFYLFILFFSNGSTSGNGNLDRTPFDEEEWDEEGHIDPLVDNGEPGVKVRALYDYEAAESDELDFKAGNLIYWNTLLKLKFCAWWKIFRFVPKPILRNKDKKSFKIEHKCIILCNPQKWQIYALWIDLVKLYLKFATYLCYKNSCSTSCFLTFH